MVLTVDQAKPGDRVHQDAALPEVVAHVLQPVGVQTADRRAVLGDPERNGDRVILPALLRALRFVEKGEDLHFCGDSERTGDRGLNGDRLRIGPGAILQEPAGRASKASILLGCVLPIKKTQAAC